MAKIKLHAGQHVHAAGWQGAYSNCTATVGTVRAYAKSYNEDEDEAEQNAIKNGHDLVYTMFGGFALYGDRKVAEMIANENRLNRKGSIELNDGDSVEIDGREYIVSIDKLNMTKPYNSDPIHFRTPAQVEARSLELERISKWKTENGYE